ncbi:ABC transporter ATP-binding protein [Amycolatopsis jejuensis]|uniref:ABC transporter ATP-binding protein n=1 Tax=Amycolatopsis jejuensis TaxID=330084 RepID=UPI0005241A17|nr:ABC transporter ATP-binding protein [Amycolatopsis jejuensis]
MSQLPMAGSRDLRDWLRCQLRTHRFRTTSVVVLSVLALAAELAGPKLLGQLVESVNGESAVATIDGLAMAFLAALVAQALLSKVAATLTAQVGERVLATTRENFVRRVTRLPLRVMESVAPGELVARATTEVDRLNDGVRDALPRIFHAVLTIALTVAAMALTSPILTLVVLVTVPVIIVSERWYRRRAVPAYERLLAQWTEVQTSSLDTVEAAATVEALRLEKQRIAHNDLALDRAARTQRRTINLRTVFFPVLDLSAFLPTALILLVGGWCYFNGLVGVAALSAMIVYADMLLEPVSELMVWQDELLMARAALRRILGVDRLERDSAPEAPEPAELTDASVHLRNVRFGYSPDREVLHDVTLDIRPGEHVVVVGPSGAGKTTLAGLIAGVHPLTSGTITVGGVGIGALPADRLRRAVALITQENYVFAGSVRDNLTLAEPPAGSGDWTDDQLWDAIRTVGADGWVSSLEDGLETEIGSGGQPVPASAAQQLALARMMLANPRVLILDEATAALDRRTSRQVERSLAAVFSGRTVIAIAHQLDPVQHADRVVLMDQGRVAAHGSHEQLLAANEQYAALWQLWRNESSPESPESPVERSVS